MIAVSEHSQGCVLPIRAQPGAKKNAILGEHAGALRVAVTAAPERGKANEAIRDVLCDSLGCKASQVAILSGEASREKRFLISGMKVEDLANRLSALLARSTSADPKARS